MKLRLRKEEMHIGALILVNANHHVRKKNMKTIVPLTAENEGVRLEAKAAATLTQLLRDIEHSDEIVPVSGYRSAEEQEAIYKGSAELYGKEFTRKFVALPGRSEHQTGLAIDLGENREDIDFICPQFPYTGICGRFRDRAPRYGFIERYTEGKESLTGISPEPWHFRYVGYPHAEIIRDMGVCLEEYIEYVKGFRASSERLVFPHKGRRIEIFYVPAEEAETYVTIPDNTPYQASGNNVDGFIVTVWGRRN